MRLLWARYGREFYSKPPHGVPENAMPALIAEATGVDASVFIERHAYGREDVDLTPLLARQGIALDWPPASKLPSMGIRTRQSHGETHIATVYEGEAGHRAGLSAGDILVAIGGLKVTETGGCDRLLRAYKPGDTVQVHVFRRDELRAFELTLEPSPLTECVLNPSE